MPAATRHLSRFAVPLVWGVTAAAYAVKAALTAATTPLILDSDDAMRLTEVRDFANGQAWFDLVQHRMNTPFGASMHWSRLVDLPEFLLFSLFRPFAGDQALMWLAWVWPLLLLLPLLLLVDRLALVLGGPQTRWPALLLTPLSLATLGEFAPGRVDHHSAQILMTLAMVLALLTALHKPRSAALAGVAGAIAIAIGVEGLPAVAAATLAIGLAFVADARQGAALRDVMLGLAVTMALALAATTSPADWLTPRLDAISIVYVAAAGGGALCGIMLTIRPARSVTMRLVAALVLSSATIGALLLAFPALRGGPYAALDPWLVRNWLANIAESQSFLTSLLADPVYPLALTVPVVLALSSALALAWRRPAERMRWLVYALLLAVGLLVMAVQIRAGRIVTPLAIPGTAVLVGLAIGWSHRRAGLLPAAAVLASLIGSAGIGVAILVALLPFDGPNGGPGGGSRLACLQPAAFSRLAAQPQQRLLAPIDLGAHLLLFTPHSVVGAPYHRNQQGLLDTFRFFNAPSEEARAIARARGISGLVICPAMKEVTGLVEHAPNSLVSDLAAGTPPSWLTETPGPGPLRVFVVKP